MNLITPKMASPTLSQKPFSESCDLALRYVSAILICFLNYLKSSIELIKLIKLSLLIVHNIRSSELLLKALLVHSTLSFTLANFFKPDSGIFGSIGDWETRFVLLFHTIAKVSVELANLVFPLLKELTAAKYLREVLINLFDLSHGVQFCLDRKLAQLLLSQLSLQIVILLFELL